MEEHAKRSWLLFLLLLSINALAAFLTFALGLADEMAASVPTTASMPDVPQWVLGLANAGLILVVYGTLGSLGILLARKSGLPGIYRQGASRRELFLRPLLIGVLIGAFFIAIDGAFAMTAQMAGPAHPPFPASIFASVAAGIGEEILFRLFWLSLWAYLLGLIFRRPEFGRFKRWAAISFAALAFAAVHLPSTMFLLGARTLSEIPAALLAEVLFLNTALGLVAGERYVRVGYLAAVGVHFWTDIVWHVIYPLILR